MSTLITILCFLGIWFVLFLVWPGPMLVIGAITVLLGIAWLANQ